MKVVIVFSTVISKYLRHTEATAAKHYNFGTIEESTRGRENYAEKTHSLLIHKTAEIINYMSDLCEYASQQHSSSVPRSWHGLLGRDRSQHTHELTHKCVDILTFPATVGGRQHDGRGIRPK